VNSFARDDLAKQAEMGCAALDERMYAVQKSMADIERELDETQKSVDKMRLELYQPFRPVYSNLPEVDLNKLEREKPNAATKLRQEEEVRRFCQRVPGDVAPSVFHEPNMGPRPAMAEAEAMADGLPPKGPVERPKLKEGDRVYCVRGNILDVWRPGVVASVTETSASVQMTLTCGRGGQRVARNSNLRKLKELAYDEPASMRLPVGTRIIAIYQDPASSNVTSDIAGDFYSGVIAEPPKPVNKWRYLIFFDDGYAAYMRHK